MESSPLLCLVVGVGGMVIGETVIRHTSAPSWYKEAEASGENSARDTQGGELERAEVQCGAFGVLSTVLQRDRQVSCTEAPASAGQTCSVASALPPAAS